MKLPKDKKIPVKIDTEFSLFSFLRRFAGIAIIVVLAYLYWGAKNELAEQVTLSEAAAAELEVWKDKDGLNNAKIQALETARTEDFLKFASKDSAIIALQNDVKENRRYLREMGSVTNFGSETSVETSSTTDVIENNEDPTSPTYKSEFDLKDNTGYSWVFGNVVATRDTTTVGLTVRNRYSLVVGQEPQGFLGLGKPKAFARVKNLNPFSETTELKTYQVSLPPPKRFGLGVFAGYGIGSNGLPGPVFGIGLTYNPIQFKF